MSEKVEHTELRKLAEAATPGPWRWMIEDYSLAILHGPEEHADHVISVSPCKSCLTHAETNKSPEWLWGRCWTPEETDAAFIAAANPKTVLALLAERDRLREALKEIEAFHVSGQADELQGISEGEYLSRQIERLRRIARTAIKDINQ